MYDGCHPPKLLEYNADTPTSLLEAAVVQWYWLEEIHSAGDQFNSIHERLIARWKELAPHIPGRHVDFCSVDDAEDWTTTTYLEDTAQQAGLTSFIFMIEEIVPPKGDLIHPALPYWRIARPHHCSQRLRTTPCAD